MKEIKWEELTRDFDEYRWKVQVSNSAKTSSMVVPYVNARDCEERLDSVLGHDGWCDEYYQVKDTLFCRLGILIGDTWVFKSGAGVEKKGSDDVKFKGEASDAFKLACVKWGISRETYSHGGIWIPSKANNKNQAEIVDAKGKKVWDVTEYVNKNFIKAQKIESKGNPSETNHEPKSNTDILKNADEMIKAIKGDISDALTDGIISEVTHSDLRDEAEKIVTGNDYKLVEARLSCIKLFVEHRAEMNAKQKEKFMKDITEMTAKTRNDVFQDLCQF